ncbi:MAG: hypothetical protein ICV85_11345 [Tolypothrix sp. T3-bin4]|nr:hypothetical protein [Tolypothrix sp. T3-bin4]
MNSFRDTPRHLRVEGTEPRLEKSAKPCELVPQPPTTISDEGLADFFAPPSKPILSSFSPGEEATLALCPVPCAPSDGATITGHPQRDRVSRRFQ